MLFTAKAAVSWSTPTLTHPELAARSFGRGRYPNATRLLITATPAPAKAGGGGSNGSRVRLWKRELQKLANQLGIDIVVSHLPPGTSKWNKIEHRLFSFISQNWRAKPLVSYRVIPGSSPRTELILRHHHQNWPHRAL